MRRIIGNYTPEEIYSRDEEGLLQEIYDSLLEEVAAKYVTFDDILLKALRLTEEVEDSINDKLVQRHLALSYEFRLKEAY